MALQSKIDTTKLTLKLQKLSGLADRVMPEIYDHFVKLTPVQDPSRPYVKDSGYAKANTKRQGSTIIADYDYAFVLDAGRDFRDGQMRGSEQAPEGMTGPTKEFAIKRIPQIIKQLGKHNG